MPNCPTCDTFLETEHGIKIHHTVVHDESLVNTVPCEQCGVEVSVSPSKEKYEKHFCSRSCHGVWREENKDEFFDRDMVAVQCEVCGMEMLKKPSEVEMYEEHYCSIECMGERYKDRLSGDGNPRWKGGHAVDMYPSDWSTIRESILKRDGYVCQVCGMGDDEHIDEFEQGLHVHHIVPLSEGGTNENENLISLCALCHRDAHA